MGVPPPRDRTRALSFYSCMGEENFSTEHRVAHGGGANISSMHTVQCTLYSECATWTPQNFEYTATQATASPAQSTVVTSGWGTVQMLMWAL